MGLKRINGKKIFYNFVWLGILFALASWLIGTCIHIFVFKTSDLFTSLVGLDLHEIYSRLSVIVLLITFGIIVQIFYRIQKRTETALQKSEERFRALFAASPDGVEVLDDKGIIIACNAAYAKTLGYDVSEIVGKHTTDFIVKETKKIFKEKWPQLKNEGKADAEIQLVNKNGTIISVWRKAIAEYDKDGEFIGAVNYNRDVTVQKQTEDELQKSEQRYRSLQNNIPVGVYRSTPQGKYLYANKIIVEMLGYESAEELYNIHVLDTYANPEEREQFKKLMETENKIVNFESHLKRKDGTYIWGSYKCRAITDENGEIIYYDGVVEDITERKLAKEALRESEEKYRLLAETTGDIIVVLDLNADISYINRKGLETTGYDYDEIVNMKFSDIVPENRQDEMKQRQLERLSGNADYFLYETEIISADGRRILVEVSSCLLKVEGKPSQALLIARDISERGPIKLRREVKGKLIHRLRDASSVKECLQIGAEAVRDAELYERAIFTTKGEYGETTHYGQVGLDPDLVEKMSKSTPATPDMYEYMFQENFKISNSYFVPVEANINFNKTGRYISQTDNPSKGPNAWQQGDELFITMLSSRGKVESYLSVDTPFDGQRPDEIIVHFLEDVVDIVARQIRDIENFETLRLSEERYRSLQANIPVGIFRTTPEGELLFANQSLIDIYGYETYEEFVQFSVYDHYASRKARQEVLAILDEKGVVADFETRVKRKDGSIIWISIISKAITDVDGNVIHYDGIIENIDERKRAEEIRNVLFNIANTINTCESLDELYPVIHRILSRIFETTNFFITLYDKDRQTLRFPYYVDEYDEYEEMSVEYTNCHYIIRTGKALLANLDIFADLNARGEIITREELAGPLIWLGAPLKRGEEVFGVVAVQSYTDPHAYDENDKEILQLVSHQIANVIERKLAEEALIESKDYYLTLIETLQEGVGIVDPLENILFANPAFRKILGYSQEELVGMNIRDLVHQEEMDKVLEETSKREMGIDGQYELVMKRKDGELRVIRISASPWINSKGELQEIVAGVLDITEHKQAEKILRESEEKYRTMMETIDDMVYICSSDLRIEYMNPVMVEEIGRDAVGESCFTIVNGLDEKCPWCIIDSVLNGESAEYELTNPRNDRTYLVSNSPLHRADGTVSKQTVLTDITDRKQAEELIKSSLAEKEILLKEIHHRVKNNLNVISSLLNLQAISADDKTVKQILEESRNRIQSMALIHDRLYHSDDLANIELGDYIQGLTDELMRTYVVYPSPITLEIHVDDVYLAIDTAIPCGMIINELVTNSLKYAYTKDDKGTITVEMYPTNEHEIELIIADGGVGFPEDFDIENAGTLGMQIVHALVRQLEGTIEVDRNNGTKFTIRFQIERK